MGKGDKKTAKGKRAMGSYGNTRQRKSSVTTVSAEKPAKVKKEKVTKAPAAKKVAAAPAEKKVVAKKAPAAKKPAAKKASEPKDTSEA